MRLAYFKNKSKIKTAYIQILTAALCLCLFAGCSKTSPTAQSQQSTKDGYQEFLLLSGKGVEEVAELLGQELTLTEETEYIREYMGEDGNKYCFFPEVDALSIIIYQNLEADAALQLAQDCYTDICQSCGETTDFPVKDRIVNIETSEELIGNLDTKTIKRAIYQYTEMWQTPYSQTMEEKVKDSRATDKVTLSLDLRTPLFADQGFFSVAVGQSSRDLKMYPNP